MALFTPTSFTAGTPALASEVNANFDAIAAILNGAITAVNVANSTITEDKLDNLSVSTGKVQDAAITNAKVATDIDAAKLSAGIVSNTEFDYLNGVTSAIQTQLNGKQASGSYHVIGDGTLADLMVFTDTDETLKSVAVTEAEALTLQGASSNIQDQLDTPVTQTNLGSVEFSHIAGTSIPGGNVDVLPEGAYYLYTTSSTSFQTQVRLAFGTWRDFGPLLGPDEVVLVWSDGTNVRVVNTLDVAQTYYKTRVYPAGA